MCNTIKSNHNGLTIDGSSKPISEIETAGQLTQSRFVDFLEYVLLFLVILEFNTAYLEFGRFPTFLFYGTVFLTFLLLLFRKGAINIGPLLVFYYLGSFLPLMNVYPGTEKRFIKLFWIVIPLFMLYFSSLRRVSFDRIISFLIKYSNIVVILALISLVYWVFGTNLEMIQPTLYVPNSWRGDGVRLIPTYHFIYFETQQSSFMGYETVRNSGIFNEGPMYNMVLCVALSMELFLRTRKSVWRIIVLIITIFTTFTTTGFLFLGVAIAWVVFVFFSQKARVFIIASLPLLIIGMMNFSNAIVEDKEDSSSGASSVDARTTDILTCIDIGLANPVLGQGLFTKKAAENEGGTYGFSNSLFTIFADGGLYTVFLYFAALVLIPLRYFSRKRMIFWPLLMFSFFIIFAFTASPFKVLTLLFVAFGLTMFTQINDVIEEELTEEEYESH